MVKLLHAPGAECIAQHKPEEYVSSGTENTQETTLAAVEALGILQTLIRQFFALTRTGRQTEMLISGLLLQYALLSNGREVSSSGQETGLLPSLSPHQGRRQQVGRNVHLLCSTGKSTELGIQRCFLTSSFNHLQLYDLGQVP